MAKNDKVIRWPDRAVFNWVSKVILQLLWFCITTVCNWLKVLTPLSRPIRSKTKTNRDLPGRVFPRLAPATCICFELWLVHWIVYDRCDWSEWLLWFWFYDTHNIIYHHYHDPNVISNNNNFNINNPQIKNLNLIKCGYF